MGGNEKRATSATRGLWATAKSYLEQVGSEDLWERLQALELLTHYAALNPQDANCVNCGAAATRLCLKLGLHHEMNDISRQRQNVDQHALNRRKTLFWNAYGLDMWVPSLSLPLGPVSMLNVPRAIHTVICQPFLWPEDAITTTVTIDQGCFCISRDDLTSISFPTLIPSHAQLLMCGDYDRSRLRSC